MAFVRNSTGAYIWEIDSHGSGPVTLKDAAGTAVGTAGNPLAVNAAQQVLLPSSAGCYGAASFRIPGTAATTHPLATVRNNAGSKVIAIREIEIEHTVSAAAAFTTQGAYFRFWVNTGTTPSGGTAPTKHKFKSDYAASQAATEILFAASADGTASAITHATPGANPILTEAHASQETGVGEQGGFGAYRLLGQDDHPIYVLSGEVCLLALILMANNITTNHYVVSMIWEEI